MAASPRANAVVGQSGGPTAVINASLAGVIEQAVKSRWIATLYGSVHAVAGMAEDHFIELGGLSDAELDLLAATPSSALGSSRDKPDRKYCQRILEVFKKRDIRYFFYIGGNDSANTANIVNSIAAESGYELRAFHIPKTVDNDLLVTDHCPGYGSAARFVACALAGDDLDNRSLPGIKINVTMGRHAGFLTAASALARQMPDDGPHLIYLPERPLSMERFLADVEGCYKRLGRCVVVASEGVCDADGVTWAQKLAKQAETDSHGNVQLSGTGALADFLSMAVRGKLGIKRVRADTFGYLQRSFAGLQSAVDAEEARECGRRAVLLSGEQQSGSVAIRRQGGPDYSAEYFSVPLADVAGGTREMPDEFITPQGNDVTGAFIDYAAPLAGVLPRKFSLSLK